MQHPQHPWQSWRDRWIKQLKGKPRPFPLPHNAPPTPPSDVPHVAKASAASKPPGKPQLKSDTVNASAALFEKEDTQALMKHGAEILEVPPENMGEAWKSWAREYDVSVVILTIQYECSLTLDLLDGKRAFSPGVAGILGKACAPTVSRTI